MKAVYIFFSSPSISKKMSGSKNRLPPLKHNAMVSFKMICDDFNFSALGILVQLELERYTSFGANLFSK